MSKKIGFVVALVGLCALSVFLVSCGSTSSRPTGILYALTQAVNADGGALGYGTNVSSFAIDLDDGYPTLINANVSTCPSATITNPAPCGLPINILLNPAGTEAYVLNQGTPCQLMGVNCVPIASTSFPPSIFTYTVNSDGSLSGPGPQITWTGSDTAVAMTRDSAGQFLFVIDEGMYPSPTTCPPMPTAATDATQAGTFAGCPSISVFTLTNGVTFVSQSSTYQSPLFLSKVPSALSALLYTPSGSGSAQEFLFVTNNNDICTPSNTIQCIPPSPNDDNTLSVYSVSSSGALTEQPNSPYTLATSDPISVLAVNTYPAGENTGGLFVYIGSHPTGSGALSIYQMCTQAEQVNCSGITNGTMVPVTVPAPPATGDNPVAMVVDPTNNYLYVVSELSNQVFGYRITSTTGLLNALSPAYQPSQGSQPVALAMQPSETASNEYLYVSNTNSSNIGGFTVNTATGAMSSPINVISNPGPTGLAAQQGATQQ